MQRIKAGTLELLCSIFHFKTMYHKYNITHNMYSFAKESAFFYFLNFMFTACSPVKANHILNQSINRFFLTMYIVSVHPHFLFLFLIYSFFSFLKMIALCLGQWLSDFQCVGYGSVSPLWLLAYCRTLLPVGLFSLIPSSLSP